jgi:hypothetical protein
MRRCRGLSVAILAVAGLAVPLWAQEGPRTSPLALLHHEGSLPNYLSAIQPSLEGWLSRTLAGPPSRPRAVALIAPLHHDGAPPDYLNAIEPRGAHGIMSPRPPTSPPPAAVRGLYLNAWLFGSSRLERLIRLADTTEINAFVIDVKDATGYLTYPSTIATAIEINANGQIRAPDTGARIARLRARGIHPIARIVVARDPLLAQGKRGWAIRDVGGGLWRDGLGKLGKRWSSASPRFSSITFGFQTSLHTASIERCIRQSERAKLPAPPWCATSSCCAIEYSHWAFLSPSTCSASPRAPKEGLGSVRTGRI